MRYHLLLLAVLLPQGAAFSQGTEREPGAFPQSAEVKGAAIAAEYLVRTVSHAKQSFLAPGYLVVEIAIKPGPGSPFLVNHGHFWLELDGGKHKLLPQPPGMVAAAIKYPDWKTRSSLEVGGGVGDAGVILGRPTASGRFPGDRRPDRQRIPTTGRIPTPDQKDQTQSTEAPPESEIVQTAALPEGETRQPVSGFLYFPWDGKPSKIKSVVLVYENASAKARLKLK